MTVMMNRPEVKRHTPPTSFTRAGSSPSKAVYLVVIRGRSIQLVGRSRWNMQVEGGVARGARVLALVHEARADEILSSVFSHLTAADLAACCAVSRYWHTVGLGQEVWQPLCDALWADKVYVPTQARELRERDARRAYAESIVDSRRTHITRAELCSFEWSTRMKTASGPGWTGSDPWWQHKPSRSRRFHADGTVDFVEPRASDSPYASLTGAAESEATADGHIIRHRGNWRFLWHPRGVSTLAHDGGGEGLPLAAAPAAEAGGAASSAGDAADAAPRPPAGPPTAADAPAGACAPCAADHAGSCLLRVRLGGREFPTMVVSRAPNWGFVMQNCWGFATSFPLPRRGECLDLEDDSALARRVSIGTQGLEAGAFNAGVSIPYPAGCFDSVGEAGQGPAPPANESFVMMRLGGQVHRIPHVRRAARRAHLAPGVARAPARPRVCLTLAHAARARRPPRSKCLRNSCRSSLAWSRTIPTTSSSRMSSWTTTTTASWSTTTPSRTMTTTSMLPLPRMQPTLWRWRARGTIRPLLLRAAPSNTLIVRILLSSRRDLCSRGDVRSMYGRNIPLLYYWQYKIINNGARSASNNIHRRRRASSAIIIIIPMTA